MFRIHTVLHQTFTRKKSGWEGPCVAYRFEAESSFLVLLRGKVRRRCHCLLRGWRARRAVLWAAGWRLHVEQQLSQRRPAIRCIMGAWRWGVGVWPPCTACTGMQHADTGKQPLYLPTYTHDHLLFPCAMACVWYLSLCQLFRCGSVFDFGISQLTGWQFKTTEWNISEPSSKLQWHTHEVMVIL